MSYTWSYANPYRKPDELLTDEDRQQKFMDDENMTRCKRCGKYPAMTGHYATGGAVMLCPSCHAMMHLGDSSDALYRKYKNSRDEFQRRTAQQRTISDAIQAARGDPELQGALLPAYKQAERKAWNAALVIDVIEDVGPARISCEACGQDIGFGTTTKHVCPAKEKIVKRKFKL